MALRVGETKINRTWASCAAAVLSVASLLASAGPSSAAEPTTKQVVVEDPGFTLTLTFDKPIAVSQADKIEDTFDNNIATGPLSSPTVDSPSASTPQVSSSDVSAAATTNRDIMFCGTYNKHTDAKASTEWRRNCEYGSLDWVTKLSAATQATVVGTVTERGMSWWVNSQFAGQNGKHVEPSYYWFHGSLPKIRKFVYVDYSDYYSWRHNIAGGGTATLSVAGGIETR